jgi:hypothetical protein
VSVVYWYSLSNHRPVPRNTRRPDPTDSLGAGLRRVEVTPALFKPRDQRRLFKVCSLVHFGSARPRVRQMSRCACTHGTHITHITHMRSLSPRLPSLFLIDTHTPCLSPPPLSPFFLSLSLYLGANKLVTTAPTTRILINVTINS